MLKSRWVFPFSGNYYVSDCSWQKCPVWGSNSRPSDYETDALPTALTRQTFWMKASFRHTQVQFYRLWLIEILKGMMDRFLTWKVGLCLLCLSMHYLDWLGVRLWGLVTSLDPLLGAIADDTDLSKLPPVRIELTTFRLWDWRAAYCAKEADDPFQRYLWGLWQTPVQ